MSEAQQASFGSTVALKAQQERQPVAGSIGRKHWQVKLAGDTVSEFLAIHAVVPAGVME